MAIGLLFHFIKNNMKKRQAKGTQNVNLPSEPSLIFGFKHNISRDFKESFTQSSRETTKVSQKKGDPHICSSCFYHYFISRHFVEKELELKFSAG